MIRDATPEDIPELVRMGRRFYEALGYDRLIAFNDRDFAASLFGWMQEHVVLITDGGMAVAVTFRSYVNHGALIAAELFFWVDPEKRGGGMALLDALEARCRALGAKTMSAVVCEGMKPESLSAAYRRRGYAPKEQTYVKEL